MSRVAAIQLNSGADVGANLANARRQLERAKADGAVLAVLPENVAFMGARDTDKLAHREPIGDGPIQTFLSQTAAELRLWIVAGTLPIAVPDEADRVHAASLVYDDRGRCVARYDKIHLFDVEVGAERYSESANITHGALTPVTVNTPVGVLGLSVCYDLRFPELYRALMKKGAQILCVPSAFTAKTGEAHWQVLLRARAVENLCYVIAPDQTGTHPGGRQTWGHSSLIDPWGCVMAECADGDGVIFGDIDLAQQTETRERFPALQHVRLP